MISWLIVISTAWENGLVGLELPTQCLGSSDTLEASLRLGESGEMTRGQDMGSPRGEFLSTSPKRQGRGSRAIRPLVGLRFAVREEDLGGPVVGDSDADSAEGLPVRPYGPAWGGSDRNVPCHQRTG